VQAVSRDILAAAMKRRLKLKTVDLTEDLA
jgi:hypothetical protein